MKYYKYFLGVVKNIDMPFLYKDSTFCRNMHEKIRVEFSKGKLDIDN